MGMSEILGDEDFIQAAEKPGLTMIPCLPEDWPLFDWEDWPESRAALVSGCPTKYFQKETWNAIIDTINDALNATGVNWYDSRLDEKWEPYTVDDSKILRPYGQLTADNFNTVCDNVDIGTPPGWAWAKDKDFPGYVGKTRFKGTTITYDNDGAIVKMKYGDKVYAEYILELVRRVNLMLGLMRGTIPIVDAEATIKSKSLIYKQVARAVPGVRFFPSYIARSNISQVDIYQRKYVALSVEQIIEYSLQKAEMEKLHAAGFEKQVESKTLLNVSGYVNHGKVYALRPHIFSKSSFLGDIAQSRPENLSAQSISTSITNASAEQAQPIDTSTQTISRVKTEIVIESNRFRSVEAEQRSTSASEVDLVEIRHKVTECQVISRTASTVALFLAVMSKIAMQTTIDLFLSAGAYCDNPIELFAHCPPYSNLCIAMPRRDAPKNLWMLISVEDTFDGAPELHTILEYYMHSIHVALLYAAPSIREIADLWLFATSRLTLACDAQTTSTQRVLLVVQGRWLYEAKGQCQVPESLMQAAIERLYCSFGGRTDTPRTNLLDGNVLIAGQIYGLLQDPNSILAFLGNTSTNNAGHKKQEPTGRYLQSAENLMLSLSSFGAILRTARLVICLPNISVTLLAELQKLSGIHLWSKQQGPGTSAAQPQDIIPINAHLLETSVCVACAGTKITIVIRVPTAGRSQSDIILYLTPEIHGMRPVLLWLLKKQGVEGVASGVIVGVRNHSGIAALPDILGSAGSHIAKAVHPYGFAFLPPLVALSQARAAATVAGFGDTAFLFLISAQGYTFGIRPALGIINIPNVAGYGASHIAVTKLGTGQPIGIQLVMSTCAISGRVANVRMQTILPDVYGSAHFEKKSSKPVHGSVSVHLTAQTAHADAPLVVPMQGNCSVTFGTACGGYVRKETATWDNPVQTEHNLHITGAWSVQHMDKSLYIE